MIRVREAYISDTGWLYNKCVDFAKFYETKMNLSANVEYAHKFLKDLIENHLVYIGEKDGMPAGFIAGFITPHHFNPDIRQLSEVLWWVEPEHRNSGVGAALLKEFVEYGTKNCDWIAFTMEEKTPMSDASLLKHGFKLTEKSYLKEVK